MGQYGQVAIDAVQYMYQNSVIDPRNAWNTVILRNRVSQKTCPRTAFLGLAENGHLLNIPPGHYLRQINLSNKIRAIRIRNHIYSVWPYTIPNVSKCTMWRWISGGRHTVDYGLIDVVYSLHIAQLLV